MASSAVNAELLALPLTDAVPFALCGEDPPPIGGYFFDLNPHLLGSSLFLDLHSALRDARRSVRRTVALTEAAVVLRRIGCLYPRLNWADSVDAFVRVEETCSAGDVDSQWLEPWREARSTLAHE